ncbi:ATP-dependent DNA helicase RecQ [Candidatus Cardinium sp. cBcalN2]|uniref:RecQ family ATP-dependent DNA helicase n=1 Tax=Candidatus Cardinium sp. cBcalN2 TaxID=2699436 RepID=UPI001FB33F35|nr:RecQ family ATP-dependent DNA helicase [Candidatus Cardinium sp. cBcalN2]
MDKVYDLLSKHWGYHAFRPLQEAIIRTIIAGRDVLVFLPTGSGKSLCFQLPALCKEGLTLVVTPLIALMKDQVTQLAQRGVHAEAIFSGMSSVEIERRLDNCLYGNVKLLYVSPERLQTDLFKLRATTMSITTLVVDEAHCISQWGYDFRPSYLAIAHFKQTIPKANTVAFTATATKRVKQDIQNRLQLNKPLLFAQTFHRPNLIYWVRKTDHKDAQLLKALKQTAGPVIIYVNTRKKTETIANFLQKNGMTSVFYHAGLTTADRAIKQNLWTQNKVRIMVATAAFGMGIDKADVSLVVHLDLPASLEAYCQEAGRAGRNNVTAYAILWYDLQDIILLKQKCKESYPTIDQIRKVYQHLVNYYKIAVGSHAFVTYDFDLADFKQTTGLYTKEAYYGLKALELEGFIQLNEAYYQPSRVYFLLSREDLYAFQVHHPAYDWCIKGLLRLYGGTLFTPYCTIVEKKIAQFTQLAESKVQEQLHALHRLKVLEYFPQKATPQITFLTPRYLATDLPLPIHKIEQRNKTAYQQIESVIEYVTNDRRCRLAVLLDYFDENELVCNQCDICKSKVTRTIKDELITEGRNYVMHAIRQGKQDLKKIIEAVAPEKEKELLDVIRAMLDRKEIYYQYPGQLQISESSDISVPAVAVQRSGKGYVEKAKTPFVK